MEDQTKYVVTYFQNEIAIRSYPTGYSLEECKQRVVEHYKETIDYINGLDEKTFLEKYAIENRHGYK